MVSEGITSVELYTDAFNGVNVTMADRIFPVDTIAGDAWFTALEHADAAWVPLRENESGHSWLVMPSGSSTVVAVRLPMS